MFRISLITGGVDPSTLPPDIEYLTDDAIRDHMALLDYDSSVRALQNKRRETKAKGRNK